ncbi:glutamine-hydrolyzing GMP synthase [Enteractinococcus coprophilus]|nr:glutamine-hydrolyzing GMP synthase [Enteractinococcus coprophilus]
MTTPQHAQTPAQDTVIVVDYGSDDAQLLARRIREAKVYSEVHSYTTGAEAILAAKPAALVLAVRSTASEDLPVIDERLLTAGIPVLAAGGGFVAVTNTLGGTVALAPTHQSGTVQVTNLDDNAVLFSGQDAVQELATNHAHHVVQAAEGFVVTASHDTMPVAAAENPEMKIYGTTWNLASEASSHGLATIKNFLFIAADLTPDWSIEHVIDQQVAAIREQIGDKRAIIGLSGGVDSAVAAALVQRAVGNQLTAVYVNHGLMRKNESAEIQRAFGDSNGAQLIMIDAEAEFLAALEGVSDPEQKRKIIGERFIRTFEQAEADIVAASANDPDATEVKFLVQGTIYPDVIESGDADGSKVIKSHHNVGGLPEDIEFKLVEPLRQLFKDEVREVGTKLGLPDDIVWRQPFPGPGLGIRIVGAITKERLDLLREADAIVREELSANGLDREIWQSPVVLLADVRSVGVSDGGRTYGHPIVLRPVHSEDAMTASFARIPYDLLDHISQRITSEVDGINRVVLDITGKPPGTIEWE